MATAATKTGKLVVSVLTALGDKTAKKRLPPPLPLSTTAQKSYAQGLEILAKQSLDPQARVVVDANELKKARSLFAAAHVAAPTFVRAKVGAVLASAMLGELDRAQADLSDLLIG